ncbi:uncharacterized protein LOC144180659 [Haemaphysalis longicornis]
MYNAVHGVYPRDAKQLKKGWGNIKQKWKEEKGEERRGRFKTGGGKEKVVITTASEQVGGVASHMATTLDNGEDSDLAPYLPPVLSQPVVQIVQRMITGEEEPSCSYAEEHQADQADEDEHGHPTGDDLAVPFSGGTEVDELDAPTGADAAVLPPQGATAPSEDCSRPPRGRMALLHQHLGTENDLRIALIKEEHDFRIKILKEDHDATLALQTEKLQLEIRLLEQKKQHQEKMFEVQTKVEEARLQQEQFQAKLCELRVKVEEARLQKALEDV